jgi:hypothetical protein
VLVLESEGNGVLAHVWHVMVSPHHARITPLLHYSVRKKRSWCESVTVMVSESDGHGVRE